MALTVKNLPANTAAAKTREFDLWIRKIPWRREWQPTPVFFLENPMGRGAWGGCNPWGHQELDMTERLSTVDKIERWKTEGFFNKVAKQEIEVWPNEVVDG